MPAYPGCPGKKGHLMDVVKKTEKLQKSSAPYVHQFWTADKVCKCIVSRDKNWEVASLC